MECSAMQCNGVATLNLLVIPMSLATTHSIRHLQFAAYSHIYSLHNNNELIFNMFMREESTTDKFWISGSIIDSKQSSR